MVLQRRPTTDGVTPTSHPRELFDTPKLTTLKCLLIDTNLPIPSLSESRVCLSSKFRPMRTFRTLLTHAIIPSYPFYSTCQTGTRLDPRFVKSPWKCTSTPRRRRYLLLSSAFHRPLLSSYLIAVHICNSLTVHAVVVVVISRLNPIQPTQKRLARDINFRVPQVAYLKESLSLLIEPPKKMF